jgi:hypothetical protein
LDKVLDDIKFLIFKDYSFIDHAKAKQETRTIRKATGEETTKGAASPARARAAGNRDFCR